LLALRCFMKVVGVFVRFSKSFVFTRNKQSNFNSVVLVSLHRLLLDSPVNFRMVMPFKTPKINTCFQGQSKVPGTPNISNPLSS
jgi:hypothetical protein